MDNSKKDNKYIPFALPYMDEREIHEVAESIKSNWISRGPKTIAFEKEFARFVGVKHAIAMNSCTAALHTALVAKGITHNDEVITTPMTFAATANIICHTGAKPVFVDIDPLTMNIDVNKIEEKITANTKAIIPVHYAGLPCDMSKIINIANKYHLFVLEDAAHAVYSKYGEKMIGSIGDATAFSFYATKNLSTGEGGMLTTNDDSLADKARILSLHGMSRNAWNRYNQGGSWFYEILYPGFKYNMTDIQAALGLCQLKKLEEMQQIRYKYVDYYNSRFSQCKAIQIPYESDTNRHAWHLYVLRLNLEQLTIDRNLFIELLNEANIGTSVHFIPVHLHPFYSDKYKDNMPDLPIVEHEYQRIISLPLYPSMTFEQLKYVADTVLDIVEKNKK